MREPWQGKVAWGDGEPRAIERVPRLIVYVSLIRSVQGWTLQCGAGAGCERSGALDMCRDPNGGASVEAASLFNTERTRRARQRELRRRVQQLTDGSGSTSVLGWRNNTVVDEGMGGPRGTPLCGPLSLTAYARCDVVGLDLSSNSLSGQLDPVNVSLLANLDSTVQLVDRPPVCSLPTLSFLSVANNPTISGSLPTDSDCLPALRELSLENTAISGAIPLWLARLADSGRLTYLNLQGMRLFYPHDDSERAQRLKPLVSACLTAQTACEGLPPISCDAFRSQADDETVYKPRTDGAGGECIECTSLVGPVILIAAAMFVAFIGICVYVWLIQRYGKAFLTRWVSTVGIFINHLQVIATRSPQPQPTACSL